MYIWDCVLMDNPDVCLCILQFLPDRDALRFAECNTMIHSLKNRILFTDEYVYDKIKDLPCFNNFCNLLVKHIPPKIPSQIKSLTMEDNKNFRDMSNVRLKSDFPKFPTTLKYLKLPTTYYSMERTSPFSDCINLEIVRMDSYLCHLFGKFLPKKTHTLILTGMNWIKNGDIPGHVINFHVEGEYVMDEHVENIRRLRLNTCIGVDFRLLVRRNMTIIIDKCHRESIEKLEWGPDFRVEYFD